MGQTNEIRLDLALEAIQSSTLKTRTDGLRDLKSIFDKTYKASNITKLTDKAYHRILEVLFRAALNEKQSCTSSKKTAKTASLTRLTSCADIVRMVVKVGARKLKNKTIEAVVDHITQILEDANGDCSGPLFQHYLKALCFLFEHPANVERLKADIWVHIVNFCVNGINQYLDDHDGEPSGLTRSFSGLGSNLLPDSLNQPRRPNGRLQTGSLSRQNVEDLLQTLSLLVSASNAPLLLEYEAISDVSMRFLKSHNSSASQLHQLALSVLNSVVSFTREDFTSFTERIASDAIPVLCRIWQGKTLAKDEMLNAVRDEMLILLIYVHPHLEHTLRDVQKPELLPTLEELLLGLKADYARRSDRDQLQLEDIEMTDFGDTAQLTSPFRLFSFRLRPHNLRAERNWATLQMVGVLERLVSVGEVARNVEATNEHDRDRYPQKRQRTSKESNRLLDPIASFDEKLRTTGLQIIPFIFEYHQLSTSIFTELLGQLRSCITDKRGDIASWALLAIASCTRQKVTSEISSEEWLQIWRAGTRALTFSATCRAAAVQLHAILARNLVQYKDVGEDIAAMITAADISGPQLLCDSAVFLMVHLLHARITEIPSASLIACQHVVRWLFARWNPHKFFETHHALHVHPHHIINLLNTSLGGTRMKLASSPTISSGPLAQAWQQHLRSHDVVRYLLLLGALHVSPGTVDCQNCPNHTKSEDAISIPVTAHSVSARKLILELIAPKCNTLLQHWKALTGDRASSISTDHYRSGVKACITMFFAISHFHDASMQQVQSYQTDLNELTLELIDCIHDLLPRDFQGAQALTETLLQSLQPYLPPCGTGSLGRVRRAYPQTLHFMTTIAEAFKEKRLVFGISPHTVDEDVMDVDDDFDTQQSTGRIEGQKTGTPRKDLALEMWPNTFYIVTISHLMLINALNSADDLSGVVPSAFIDELLSMADEELLSCRALLREILDSDLTLDLWNAGRLLSHLGTILSSSQFDRCEVALGICLDVLIGLEPLWSLADGSDLAEFASDLYRWFVETALYKGVASPSAQKGISRLLLSLLRGDNPEYGVNLGLHSPRSGLFHVLEKSSISVKFFVGKQLPQIFELFILKDHEDIFVDILENLPSDPSKLEEIAFRLYVLAKLASRWPTLLRRCIYHIIEVPGKIPESVRHATYCVTDISDVLKVETPRVLFGLFSSQILYTWLEAQEIEQLPFRIFGFADIKDLLVHFKAEAAALMIMRDQDTALERVAVILELPIPQLLKECFTRIMAYSIAHDTRSSSSGTRSTSGESRVKRHLGNELFFECLQLHFADILALRFSIIDQEENAAKYFAKEQELVYAANIIKEIKALSCSDVVLPPNQQPAFKAKYLPSEIDHLCSRTRFEPRTVYNCALVVLIVRKLFNIIHPALGSLHACAVLRKVRILIALSGDSSLTGYPLEMLLHSVRPFVTDPECADDAIGIAQYLLTRGSKSLLVTPSFLAGFGLSALGAMRIFLQSSRSSSTQESQFKNTMSKAQAFHKWIGDYLLQYHSSILSTDSTARFRALVKSAYAVRSIGNADSGSPESDLLYRLLEDEKSGESILSRPAREYALSILCSEFKSPASYRKDIFGDDNLAIKNAAVVWKSSRSESASIQYLNWAARVLGRAFVASGHIHEELLQESTLGQIQDLYTRRNDDERGSRAYVLSLLQALTLGHDGVTVGLVEAALRATITTADESLAATCWTVLPPQLYVASHWSPYSIAPSDVQDYGVQIQAIIDPFSTTAILRTNWLRDLSVVLAQTVPNDPLLRSLIPILLTVPGFATRAFPFLLHMILSIPSEGQQFLRKQLSAAFVAWFSGTVTVDKNNLKMLINSILYLRTQPMPQERSLADRSHWLEVDYVKVATSAAQCGMYKTALLLIEQSFSGQAKASRRSSVKIGQSHDGGEIPTELLLTIFQNIDDPDLYYGVQQEPNLTAILARFEYERDGPKSLAFRGALYDSHVRMGAVASAQDAESLVKALDVLSLSGLSHSLLQAQQSSGMSSTSLESMFRTARRLEQWDIPVPSAHNNNSVTIYKAFQSIDKALNHESIRSAINEGLENTMKALVRQDLGAGASALHASLQTLASLVELDELLSNSGSEALEQMLERFRSRSGWMKTGRFDDITQILSCRGTSLSTLSQRPRLQEIMSVSQIDTRLVEVHTALLACNLNRAHGALQESLSLATSLMELLRPCQELGLNIEAAVQMEAANALWEQGEVTSSIGMLQAIDSGQISKKQSIHVGRSDLLAKIGHQVSVARLEKADKIIENYLRPALKDLRGKSQGSEAGQVFHQFAVFCDQQLQDPDSLEDLERLRKLSKMKKDEVEQLEKMVANAVSGNEKARYKAHLGKARSWFKLDEEELQRHNASRDVFLRQSLENYLLALSASDGHDNNALRFSALWLEHSESQLANEAVSNHLRKVPSRKFAPLMNQVTSRLQESPVLFQKLLFDLVLRICEDHPFHGMYQIYAAANSKPNSKDESAISRHKATNNVAKQLAHNGKVQQIWSSISATNKAYCALAGEKDDSRYKSGRKIPLKESPAGTRLNVILAKHQIPPPTMQIPLAADLDYSQNPVMVRFDSQMSIASGVSAPKIVTAVANNGARYKQLVKGGNDDLRQDAIMEQVFEQVSELLKSNRTTRQRDLSIRTYKVLPLTSSAGVIEFVANTTPLHDFLMPAHERYYPKDLKGNQCRKEIGDVQNSPIEVRIKKFRSVTERFHPVMRYFFIERFTDPDEWFAKRNAYTRSTAAISILGHVLGLGDRHGHNILLNSQTGEVVHIDLGVAFEMGRVLPVPELVPFRLTRDIVDGMGITNTEGVFRRCCEFTLEALRKEAYSIMTILDVLRYDPLYNWSISPVRLAKLQEGQSAAPEPPPSDMSRDGNGKQKEITTVNEPGEADRALTVVNKKLSKTLSVTATVNDLINQASDERNLAVLYSGWAAYA